MPRTGASNKSPPNETARSRAGDRWSAAGAGRLSWCGSSAAAWQLSFGTPQHTRVAGLLAKADRLRLRTARSPCRAPRQWPAATPDARRFYRKVAEKEGGLVEAVQPVPGPHRGTLGPYGSPRARRRRTCHSSLAVGAALVHAPPHPTTTDAAAARPGVAERPSRAVCAGLGGPGRRPPAATGGRQPPRPQSRPAELGCPRSRPS